MAKKELGIFDKTTVAVKDETKQIIDTVEKAKDKRTVAEKIKNPERRITGVKVGMWIGIFYMFVRVYQRTPMKHEINRLFEEKVI